MKIKLMELCLSLGFNNQLIIPGSKVTEINDYLENKAIIIKKERDSKEITSEIRTYFSFKGLEMFKYCLIDNAWTDLIIKRIEGKIL